MQSKRGLDLEQLALVAEIAPVSIVYFCAQKRYRYANRHYLRQIGKTWDEIRDRPIREVMGDDVYARIEPRIADALGGKVVHYETSFVMPHLGRRYMRISYAPDAGPGGAVKGLVAVLDDITPTILAQKRKALQYEANRVFGAALSLSDAVPVLERIGKFVEAETVHLWTPDPGGEAFRCRIHWPDGEAAACKAGVIRRKDGVVGRAWASRETAETPGAIGVPIVFRDLVTGVIELLSERKLLWGEGESTSIVAVAEHFGQFQERLRLEERVREGHKMEAIGRLAGGIAHDFNNLLAVVVGYGEIIRADVDERRIDPAELSEQVEEILGAAERAVQLTRQLLAFGRKQMIRTSALNLEAVIQSVLPRLRKDTPDDIRIELKSTAELGSIRGDPDQILEILQSLCTNAREAMPKGGDITLRLENVELDEVHTREMAGAAPGPYVQLSVSDTGLGMDTETQRHIFEPFFSTRGPAEKRGLGLAVVYGIVRQSGGHIWVYSEVGKGTTFKTYFPRIEGPAMEPRPVSRPGTPARGGTETILLVEDDRHLRNVAAHLLREAGYHVIEARSGEQALDLAGDEETIHMVLTDITMPGIHGPALIERLRAMRPGIRCMLMSGYSEDVVKNQGQLDEGVPFLSKPFSVADLLSKVRATLDAKPSR